MQPLYRSILPAVLCLLGSAGSLSAQVPDTLEGALPEVEIEAARAAETPASAPFAVSLLARSPVAVALEPALSLENVLRELPGLWVSDPGHDALGERISIRGMGWRAAFGVRGVQVLLDGIPLTMPDGQAFADIAEPALIRRAELIRGPAALFWGNAAGGALFLSTIHPGRTSALRARALAGSYGLRQLLAEYTAPVGRHHLQAYASHVEQEGFRNYSEGRFTRSGLHGQFDLGARTQLRLTGAFALQDAQNPGSLTAEQVAADRFAAAAGNLNTRSGKESLQLQLGTTLLRETGLGLLSATAYGLIRDLDNPLPFAYVDLFRRSGGLRLALQDESDRLRWGTGLDLAAMYDDRLNFDNVGGEPGTELGLDQQETVQNAALFAYVTRALTRRFALTAGLRGDVFRFTLDDALLADGDESGERIFAAWSPSAGLTYRLGRTLLFANANTAFETPTTTELVNRPDAAGGFNPELEPQRTRGVEAGARGAWPAANLRFDAALFHMWVTGGLIPFQNELGRTFYRNVGEYTHAGAEAVLQWQPLPAAGLLLSYTGGRHLREGGDELPGVPPHRLFAELEIRQGGLWGKLSAEVVDSYFVDDDNTARNDGYTVAHLNVGHDGLRVGTAELQPFFRVGNLFDRLYNSSVVVNAFGGRFYEPGPGRTVQAGLNVAF